MNKVICDICGTTYPETASQCPICGCAKPEDISVLDTSATSQPTSTGTYTYVKGGRFSKSNVKKRKQAVDAGHREDLPRTNGKKTSVKKGNQSQESSGNGFLVALLILLLVGIAAVSLYIYFNFFAQGQLDAESTSQTTTAATTTEPAAQQTTEPIPDATTSDTTPSVIPCTGIALSDTAVTLDTEGDTWLLDVKLTPANTTDSISYHSADETVATVDATGKITAVSDGKTVITVTCGNMTASCEVTCELAQSVQTVPEETTTQTQPEASEQYTLSNKYGDVTISVGEKFSLEVRDSNGKAMDVTWNASKSGICKIKGNQITGVAVGQVILSCTYAGKNFECIVRVK